MKLHKLLLALCLLPSMLSAQYGLEVEVVSEDIGVIVGVTGSTDLTGYACYRAYITMANEADFLSSISGDANNPTYVTSSTDNLPCGLGCCHTKRNQQHSVSGLP